jgi:hypothetical protein
VHADFVAGEFLATKKAYPLVCERYPVTFEIVFLQEVELGMFFMKGVLVRHGRSGARFVRGNRTRVGSGVLSGGLIGRTEWG